jgi:hypothetical protein
MRMSGVTPVNVVGARKWPRPGRERGASATRALRASDLDVPGDPTVVLGGDQRAEVRVVDPGADAQARGARDDPGDELVVHRGLSGRSCVRW